MEVCARAQEAQHYAFDRNVGTRQLTNNPRAQRIVRWVLHRLWTPVGVGLRPPEDTDRLLLGLFGNRPDQIIQMDGQLNQIPGLTDLDLLQHCLHKARAA